jgi:hypothetical protein
LFSLGADGGHNVREVVTGITITAIALKTFLNFFDADNTNQGIRNIIKQTIIYFQNQNILNNFPLVELENIFIKIINNTRIFINDLYVLTSEINPLGFFEKDINTPEKQKAKDEFNIKDANGLTQNLLYDIWFNRTNDKNTIITYYNTIMLLTGLDNNRYMKDPYLSFEGAPYLFISKLFNNFGGDFINQLNGFINQQLDDTFKRCNFISMNNLNMGENGIPFAFSTNRLSRKKKTRKSIRISRKKKTRKSIKLSRKNRRTSRKFSKK